MKGLLCMFIFCLLTFTIIIGFHTLSTRAIIHRFNTLYSTYFILAFDLKNTYTLAAYSIFHLHILILWCVQNTYHLYKLLALVSSVSSSPISENEMCYSLFFLSSFFSAVTSFAHIFVFLYLCYFFFKSYYISLLYHTIMHLLLFPHSHLCKRYIILYFTLLHVVHLISPQQLFLRCCDEIALAQYHFLLVRILTRLVITFVFIYLTCRLNDFTFFIELQCSPRFI
jgi:hypothetical protein